MLNSDEKGARRGAARDVGTRVCILHQSVVEVAEGGLEEGVAGLDRLKAGAAATGLGLGLGSAAGGDAQFGHEDGCVGGCAEAEAGAGAGTGPGATACGAGAGDGCA